MDDATIRADRERLEDILARDEFLHHTYEQNGFWEWIGTVIENWLKRLGGVTVPGNTGEAIAAALYTGLILILLLFLILLVRRWVRAKKRKARAPLSFRNSLKSDAVDYMRKAEEHAQAGNYREAVRFSFIAGVMLMDARRWIRAEAWKTNREYRDELRETESQAVSSFARSAFLFEQIWYGDKTADEGDYRQISAWLNELSEHEGGERDDAEQA